MAKGIKRIGMIFFVLVLSCLLITGCFLSFHVNEDNNNKLSNIVNSDSTLATEDSYDFELSGNSTEKATIWNNAITTALLAENRGKTIKVRLQSDWTASASSDTTSFGSGTGFSSGRIYVPQNANITLDLNGHTINRNLTSVKSNGHVIYVYGGELTVIDSSYNHDTALQTYRTNPQNLKNLAFGKITGGYCTGGANGAGIRIDHTGRLNIYGGIITGNHSEGIGGAIGTVNENFFNTINIYDGVFVNNISDSNGGAIGITISDTLNIEGGIIANNQAKTNGGGINIAGPDGDSKINISNVIISYNSAGTNGGGFSISGGTSIFSVNFSNCEITNNVINGTSAQFGCGVYLTNYTYSNFDNCIIKDNHASGNSAVIGGGIYVNDNSCTIIKGGEISNNVAGYAGGMYIGVNAKVELSNIIFDNNVATTNYAGAIAINSNCVYAKMNKLTITNNTAEDYAGGVVVHSNSFVKMTECNVSNNTSKDKAGGIHVSTNSYFEINNCTIDNNTSQEGVGGGIFCNSDVKCGIKQSTITNNSAQRGGGIYANASAMVIITDTEITNNIAINTESGGGGLYIASNASVKLDADCVVSSNKAMTYGGGLFVNSSDFTMNGAKIYGNTLQNNDLEVFSDIYLNYVRLNVTQQIVCEEDKKIYIQLPADNNKFNPFTLGYSNYGNAEVDPNSIFASADGNLTAVVRAGEVIFDYYGNSVYDFIYLEDGMRKNYKDNEKLHGYNDSEVNIIDGNATYILGNISPNTSVNTFVNNLMYNKEQIQIYQASGILVYDKGHAGVGISAELLDNSTELAVGTGWRVIYNNNGNTEEIYLSVLGDINGDGRISASDVATLREIANNKAVYENLSVECKLASMVINKGNVTTADAEIVNNVINKLFEINIFF